MRLLERQRNHDVALVLDLWRPEHPHQVHLERVELAVSFAATVVADLCNRGDCRLLVAGAGIRYSTGLLAASPLLAEELLAGLAEVQGSPADKLSETLQAMQGIVRPDTCRLVISTRASLTEMSREPNLSWLNVSDEAHLVRLFQIE